jgi:nucleoside-diphosphate-sugar epimerase
MTQYKNKKVLVTGGAGFIGSHLVDQLVSKGADVTVLDNLSTGTKDNLKQSINSIKFIEGDIRDAQTCINASTQCEYVFHFAACVSVPQSIQEPVICHDSNINGTFNLLEAAKINNIKRFVFSSSCAVYGQQTQPCCESTPCNPTSPYAYSKWMGELLCQQYTRVFNVPTVCLRYFNVIGKRQSSSGPYAGVYAKFSDLMQKNEPITIFGDGQQTRDFVPVDKVVQANLTLALLSKEQCNGQPINIGTGITTSVLDTYKKLEARFNNYKKTPVHKPARSGDIYYSCANIELYKKLTNFEK